MSQPGESKEAGPSESDEEMIRTMKRIFLINGYLDFHRSGSRLLDLMEENKVVGPRDGPGWQELPGDPK